MSQKNNHNYMFYLKMLDKILLIKQKDKEELETKDKNILSLKNNLEKDKKEFIFETAHELQTPLIIMKNEFLNLQKKYPEDKNLFVLEESLDKLSFFINNILDSFYIKNNFNKFDFEKINLSNLLLDMIESFEIIFESKKINILKNIKKNIFFNCNKKDIIQIINNIVSNSVKYISNDKKIFINLDKKYNKIFLSIKDTGIGIDRKELKYVFNKYYRSKNNLNIKGSGLGLTICKKIAENYKGKIFIDSQKDKWTEVLVIL